ncbi:MAG: uridine phosphorylase [Actinomycetota bacterium]|jgi:uridine phosphorylase|uniref:uridine phosphorylase n=1 Tax=uncultured Ilumatobacter sp. TaxID=879968 RepID=UPI00374EB6EC|nr:uridine phosphorylase [Actinomycetota bacterium]
MAETFHLGLNASDISGATLAIVPGDPDRVARIAQLLDEPRALAAHREFTSWIGKLDGNSVVVCSTGIGGPSTSIAVEELAQLGVTTFLRVGTTGGIQPNVNPGDVIVTTGAVRLDGASLHFAPMEFPAVADFECTTALVAAARDSGSTTHVGITASSDTFYPGQERYDTTTGRVVERLRGSLDEWQSMGVLNYEMESATLFTMCASSGWRAGCVAGVLVNRTQQEMPDAATIAATESNAVAIVVAAARQLAS